MCNAAPSHLSVETLTLRYAFSLKSDFCRLPLSVIKNYQVKLEPRLFSHDVFVKHYAEALLTTVGKAAAITNIPLLLVTCLKSTGCKLDGKFMTCSHRRENLREQNLTRFLPESEVPHNFPALRHGGHEDILLLGIAGSPRPCKAWPVNRRRDC